MKRGDCRHFNGLQNKTCKAGVDYGEVRIAGCALPCLHRGSDARPMAECARYEEVTDDDFAALRAEIDVALERHRKAAPAIMEIRKAHKGKSARGVIECPCCEGKLHWSISGYNGHMHGRCTTEGCLNWME